MIKTDVAIIGGGPGGVAAALRARTYGFKTHLIEKNAIGGVCLHQGCIPTKSLLEDASRLRRIAPSDPASFFPKMIQKKEAVVSRLHQGATAMLKKEGVVVIPEAAFFQDVHRLQVGEETLEAKFFIIATGSYPRALKTLPFDGEKVLSSDDLLKLKEIPKSLLVVGGGPTGCEFASLYHALGTEVTLLEAMSTLLPGQDEEVSEGLKRTFQRQGIQVVLKEEAIGHQITQQGVVVSTKSKKTLEAEKVLVSVGRLPRTEALGVEALGVRLEKGCLSVNTKMQTSIPTLFAIGDVVGKWPLAHVAAHQGRIAVDTMAGRNVTVEEKAIPEGIFTFPEVARVGLSEREARKQEKDVEVGRSTFMGSSKAHILEEKEGFVKLVGNAKTGRLLGAHLVGPHVTELLSELTLALRMGIGIPELEATLHPHPTLSESVEEAARDFIRKGEARDDSTVSNMAAKTD